MAIPTLEKSWQYSFNLANTPSGVLETDIDNVHIIVKNALLAFASHPWTVIGSSSGSASSMDGTDRITSVANIVHNTAGNAHSWWVLKDTVSGVSACYDCNSADQQITTVIWSPGAGFTGGSTTARPTATDEQSILSTWIFGTPGGTGAQYKVHCWRASDGTCTRVMVCGNSIVTTFLSFESPSAAATGWALPVAACAASIGASFSDATLLNASNWIDVLNKYVSKGPIGNMGLRLTAEGAQTTSIVQAFNAANEISNEWPIIPVGAWHNTTVGQRGRHGYFADLFFTCAAPITGDTFPSDASHQFQIMGDMVVPTGGNVLTLG